MGGVRWVATRGWREVAKKKKKQKTKSKDKTSRTAGKCYKLFKLHVARRKLTLC